jgi:hypothetical protein
MKRVKIQSDEKYSNPPDMKYIAGCTIVSILFLVFAFDTYDGYNIKIIPTIILLSAGLGLLVMVISREIIHRPYRVRINNNGAEFDFKFLKRRFLSWDEILWMIALPGDSSKNANGWDRDGGLLSNERTYYPLTYEIAAEIRNAHFGATGRYPMTKEEFKKQKKAVIQQKV